jgi:tryptophan 2,3-dioxygenase
MTPKAVEYLLTQDARLLARRDAPVIDQDLEQQRQAALEIFFQWQDGMREFQDLMPFCVVLQRQVDLNRELLKWEYQHAD